MLQTKLGSFWFVGLPISYLPGKGLATPALAYVFQGKFVVVNRSGQTICDKEIKNLKLALGRTGNLTITSGEESLQLNPGGSLTNRKVAEKLISYVPEALTAEIVAGAKQASQQGKLQEYSDQLKQTASVDNIISQYASSSFSKAPGAQMTSLLNALEGSGAKVVAHEPYSLAAVWIQATIYLVAAVLAIVVVVLLMQAVLS